MAKYFFLLGGHDAEMERIRMVLENARLPFLDKFLGWGAKASAYGEDLPGIALNYTPVMVELEIDCELPEGTIVVDHHGSRSAEPASLLQVLTLLGIEPTRLDRIVAANDSGWFAGMQAIGATAEEMEAVRAMDRAAQGITDEQETEAVRALAREPEYIGPVRVIRMSHSKCAPVGDRLAVAAIAAGKPIPQYLVLSQDGEVNFSGDGALCATLKEKFGGWNGGSGLGKAGETAYWGGYPDHEAVVEFIREAVGAK